MDDVTFTRGPARRPLPRIADPLLQWSTGLQTKDRRIYAGWLAEAGRVEAFDHAMEQAGFSQITIRHGSGNMVTHWAVETANLFVIAEGVQSIGEMKNTNDRYGIAFGWRTLDGGRQQSVLRLRALLHELLDVGFYDPLMVTIKSTLTGDMIAALTRQYEVLDAVELFRAKAGKQQQPPPFYACSIPLGAGREVARGSVQTKEIAPIVAQIPTPVTKEYILAHWIKRDWAEVIEGSQGGPSLLDLTIAWSVMTSQLIAMGEEQVSAPPEEEAPHSTRFTATQGNGRRRIDE